MKLQFDANQEYQIDAVQAVVRLFEGQPTGSQMGLALADDGLSSLALSEAGIANRRVIDDLQWLNNLHAVQDEHQIERSTELEPLKLSNGSQTGRFPNFTVEMETGTGKTYVYLRTVQELHKTYGFKKFVIVVPSVAIREGVLKSLEITREHFQTLYGFERTEFMVYDSSRASQLRNFAHSDAIQILILNIDAFAKDSSEDDEESTGTAKKKSRGNVINQRRETGVRPIQFIQDSHPIVILDEPQNLETDNRKQAIARLNPICTLRYSATHRDTYNLIYSLDPVRAYELGLVKQIGVDSVVELKDANQAYVEVESFRRTKTTLSATLKIWVNQADGPAKKSVKISVRGEKQPDLFEISNGREMYRGFLVNEINDDEGWVEFANGLRVRQGEPNGALTDAVLRLQVEATIRRHFEKALRLHPLGIKVLSVFFIDRVANYRSYATDGSIEKGKFAQWFEEIYQTYSAKPEYSALMPFAVETVHNGYFSQDKGGTWKDSTERGGKDDDDAYALIMRDKERLLDLAEPLAFIFSHSALREGWDNPNVFQICTLAETRSEIKKRQELGRGLRLCVNQDGVRIRGHEHNKLTVIANIAYEDFAKQLQSEMEAAGVTFKREHVHNERDKVQITLKKGYQNDHAFIDLWEHIRARTRYRVNYDTEQLVANAAKKIKGDMPTITAPRLAVYSHDLTYTQGVSGTQTGIRSHDVSHRYVMPDFVGQVQAKTGLAKSTVARILLGCDRLGDAIKNPQAFIDLTSEAINAVKRGLLVEGVEYFKVDSLVYEMRKFEETNLNEVFLSNVVQVKNQDKTLFSHIVIDSNSGPERRFAEACETNEDVLFYIKLPKWFEIETPVGPYCPDWALAYRDDKTIYFVAETKDTGNESGVRMDLLRPIEELKIKCGIKHFKNFEEVQFKPVKTLDELITSAK